MLNSLFGAASQVILAITGFFLQRIFVSVCGLDTQGLYTTLTTVITMLCITELGIGAAINCRLYTPLADHDDRKIISLMSMYGRLYRIIATIIFAVGMIIAPFLPKIIGDACYMPLPESNIALTNSLFGGLHIGGWVIFGFLLIDTASSYLLAYKRSIIMADQRNYVILSIHTAGTVLMQFLQASLLLITKDIILFLILQVTFRFTENLTLALIANRKYPVITSKEKVPVDDEMKRDIWGNTAALSMHYVGNYAIDSVDTIIISNYLGPLTAGIYANYLLIMKGLRGVMIQFSSGFTASFGNILAEREHAKDPQAVNQNLYVAFKKAYFVTFILANFATVSFFCLIDVFISTIWMKGATDEEILLPLATVAILALNFCMTCLAETLGSLRAAAGLFRPDRYLHLAMAVLNLILSLILVKQIGIIGVFIGTTICKIIKEVIDLPKIVYKEILGQKPWKYRLTFIGYLLTTVVGAAVTFMLCRQITVENVFLNFVLRVILCCIVPNVICILAWGRSAEFKYLIDLLKTMSSGLRHHAHQSDKCELKKGQD